MKVAFNEHADVAAAVVNLPLAASGAIGIRLTVGPAGVRDDLTRGSPL